MANRKQPIKLLVKPEKFKHRWPPLRMKKSFRKADLPPGWFHWLGILTHSVVIEFDERVDVEFQDTPFAYYITVCRTEKPK